MSRAAPYLGYSEQSGLGRIVAAALPSPYADLVRRPVFQAHLAAALRSMVLAGRGVAWLPRSLIADDWRWAVSYPPARRCSTSTLESICFERRMASARRPSGFGPVLHETKLAREKAERNSFCVCSTSSAGRRTVSIAEKCSDRCSRRSDWADSAPYDCIAFRSRVCLSSLLRFAGEILRFAGGKRLAENVAINAVWRVSAPRRLAAFPSPWTGIRRGELRKCC